MRIKLFDLALEYQNKSNHKEASMGEIQMLYPKQTEQSGCGSLKVNENWWEGRCEQTLRDRIKFTHSPVQAFADPSTTFHCKEEQTHKWGRRRVAKKSAPFTSPMHSWSPCLCSKAVAGSSAAVLMGHGFRSGQDSEKAQAEMGNSPDCFSVYKKLPSTLLFH